MLMLTAPPKTMLLLVRILVPLRAWEANVNVWFDVNVLKFVKISEPKIVLAVLLIAHVGVPLAPDQSMLLPKRGISPVTVLPVPDPVKTTLSCGKGTREVQLPTVDQLPEGLAARSHV